MAKSTGQKKEETGRNIKYWQDGDRLLIEIDLTADMEPSGSGKTNILATTQGNKRMTNDLIVGLNAYRYAEKKKKR